MSEHVDKNFNLSAPPPSNCKYVNALDIKNALYGVYYDEEDKIYRRMPNSVAKTVNFGVTFYSKATTGGRLKLKTNSNYIAIKATVPKDKLLTVMPSASQFGFAISGKGVYYGFITYDYDKAMESGNTEITFEGTVWLPDNSMRELTVHFPVYGTVNELFIGAEEGSVLEKGCNYLYEKPIVFYGSSITHGGCASRSDNDYPSMLSKMLDSNYLNLGFAGSCHGEQTMAEYLAGLDASVFVIDYDANATEPKELEENHYPLYQIIRNKNPETPIVFITRPHVERGECSCASANVTFIDYNDNKKQKDLYNVIYNNYLKAKENGDNNLYFIDGHTLFGTEFREFCTVDGTHPNDLGFYRMAQTIYPVLKEILEK